MCNNLTLPPFEVRRDPAHNILGSVIYIFYYNFVFSLKMAFIAEKYG